MIVELCEKIFVKSINKLLGNVHEMRSKLFELSTCYEKIL